MNIFRSDLLFDMILFDSNFKIQELSVMLVASLTNFNVKNQVPQVFSKFVARDLMLVSSYEVADIVFCDSLVLSKAISDYVAQEYTLHGPKNSLPFYLITCTYPHSTSKYGDITHSPGHLLLTLGENFSSHGSMFNAETYQFLGFTSHGSNSQVLFLSHHLILDSLHGSIFHLVVGYVPDSVDHIPLLPKRKIPSKIII